MGAEFRKSSLQRRESAGCKDPGIRRALPITFSGSRHKFRGGDDT
jgi:hypothetical protein